MFFPWIIKSVLEKIIFTLFIDNLSMCHNSDMHFYVSCLSFLTILKFEKHKIAFFGYFSTLLRHMKKVSNHN